jgi:hypothetical protein
MGHIGPGRGSLSSRPIAATLGASEEGALQKKGGPLVIGESSGSRIVP